MKVQCLLWEIIVYLGVVFPAALFLAFVLNCCTTLVRHRQRGSLVPIE